MVIEEQHVRLHPVGVKDTGGQAQDGVQLSGFQQLPEHGFARTTFEQYVVRHHHGRASGGFQHGADVLHKGYRLNP